MPSHIYIFLTFTFFSYHLIYIFVYLHISINNRLLGLHTIYCMYTCDIISIGARSYYVPRYVKAMRLILFLLLNLFSCYALKNVDEVDKNENA